MSPAEVKNLPCYVKVLAGGMAGMSQLASLYSELQQAPQKVQMRPPATRWMHHPATSCRLSSLQTGNGQPVQCSALGRNTLFNWPVSGPIHTTHGAFLSKANHMQV